MTVDKEERIERLLDQLEAPGLTATEIARIEQKLKILQDLE